MPMARGRPWSFDRKQALHQAMMLFWERGYSATPLRPLQTAMSIAHPQSFRSAFGSKQKLFEAALGSYWERYLQPVLAALNADEPIEAFQTLFAEAAQLYTHWSPARGCLILTSSVNLRAEDEEVGLLIAEYRRRIERAIEDRLSRAVDDEHLRPMQKAALAELCFTILYGMALRAQSGAGCDDLLGGTEVAIRPFEDTI
ncbi:TetR/AcrR family transcriptional regulator [Methylobacterium radiotolerans]